MQLLSGSVFVMPKVFRVLLIVGLGFAATLSVRPALAAIGDLSGDHGPADSFWLGRPGFGHHPAEWGTSGVPYRHTNGTMAGGLTNPFVPPPVEIFLESNRGGFYGTLLQTLRFGIMTMPGSDISMMSTPILFAPDGEPVLLSTQVRWVSSGPGQLVMLDWRFNSSRPGNLPSPQGGGGGTRLSAFGGSTGPGGIGGGGGGARRTASTPVNDPGSNNPNQDPNNGQTPSPGLSTQLVTVDAPAPVPAPGALILFGSGLAALFVAGRKKKT